MKNFTENLPLNFFNSAKISKEKKLFYDKINGNWRSISFSEAKANVISIANFLLEIGIKKKMIKLYYVVRIDLNGLFPISLLCLLEQ